MSKPTAAVDDLAPSAPVESASANVASQTPVVQQPAPPAALDTLAAVAEVNMQQQQQAEEIEVTWLSVLGKEGLLQ